MLLRRAAADFLPSNTDAGLFIRRVYHAPNVGQLGGCGLERAMSDKKKSDEEEVLPSIETFLLEDGLYRERGLYGDWSFVKGIITGPSIQFDAYCPKCKAMSTFRDMRTRGSGAGM